MAIGYPTVLAKRRQSYWNNLSSGDATPRSCILEHDVLSSTHYCCAAVNTRALVVEVLFAGTCISLAF